MALLIVALQEICASLYYDSIEIERLVVASQKQPMVYEHMNNTLSEKNILTRWAIFALLLLICGTAAGFVAGALMGGCIGFAMGMHGGAHNEIANTVRIPGAIAGFLAAQVVSYFLFRWTVRRMFREHQSALTEKRQDPV